MNDTKGLICRLTFNFNIALFEGTEDLSFTLRHIEANQRCASMQQHEGIGYAFRNFLSNETNHPTPNPE